MQKFFSCILLEPLNSFLTGILRQKAVQRLITRAGSKKKLLVLKYYQVYQVKHVHDIWS